MIETVWIDNITQLRKVTRTVTLVRLENCIHQSKLQESIEGPMENAVKFLIIPAPSWWGSPEGGGRSDSSFLFHPPIPRADPDGRGGDQWTQGVGELESHLVEQGGQS